MLNISLTDIDISILREVQNNRILAFDHILYIISFISSYISIGIVLTIFITSLIKRSKQLRMIFFKMLAVFIVAALVSFTLKIIITRERPYITYPDIEKLSEAGNSSFPSGHTLEAFAIAVALSSLVPKRKFVIPVFIWACLVAYSRMALGVHYPSDVLSGMIIGSLIGWLIPVFTKPKPFPET
jgi:undecaprenyl-diphosphatase